MHKPGPRWQFPVYSGSARLLPVACLLLLSACATQVPGPLIEALPVVSPESAATLKVRSKVNFTDIKHRHVLRINGATAGVFKEEDTRSFELAGGTHQLELTCHSRYMRGDNVFPFNYNVIDGQTSMQIDLQAGESLCLKIGFKPLDCALLQQSPPDYCE